MKFNIKNIVIWEYSISYRTTNWDSHFGHWL